MKGFFDVFGFIVMKRKTLLVVTLLFSMVASGLVMYEKNLSVTINGSYDSLPEGETSYLYKIEGMDSVLSVDDTLFRNEQSYYKMLKKGTTFNYHSYFNTTATIQVLKNKGLAINLDGNGNAPTTGYKVKVLFTDLETIKGTPVEEVLSPLFSVVTDYDKYVPCVLGYQWLNEGYKLGSDRVSINTTLNNYEIVPHSILNEGTKIKVGRVEVNLDEYIIIPLIEVENCKMPDRQSELERWHNIYSVLINGYITSEHSANAVQKELFQLAKDSNMAEVGNVIIRDADYNSRYIFRDDLDGVMQSVKAASVVALILNTVFLLVYAVYNSIANNRYFYIQTILGKSKISMALASILVIWIYFVAAVIGGQGVAMIMAKVLGTKVASMTYVLKPQLYMSAAISFILLVRFLVLDVCKSQRRSK